MKEPSVKETAFSCPHCGAYTTQYWHDTYVKYISGDRKIPAIPDEMFESIILNNENFSEEAKQRLVERCKKMRLKLLFSEGNVKPVSVESLNNMFLSSCFNCKKWAAWVNEDLIYPPKKFGSLPNQDLPQDVLAVVEEARATIVTSPKGAAALLRLAIQMLCKYLGETGNNLNDDIASLVRKGLKPLVAKSLDVVRVIGNEAVHPGTIDLNDDKDTAISLFELVNIIADQMITQPKNVDELYAKIPESKRKAIERRDKKQ